MAVPFSNTKLRVPKGFQNILEGLAREILRSQPENPFEFGAKYFEQLLKVREETGHDPAVHGARLEDRFYNNDSFKSPSVDSGSPQQQDAALKIQTNYRKHVAEETVAKMKEEEAAEKIQAGFRGFQDRQKYSEMKDEKKDEEVDIDLNDPDVEAAAVKIQAGFKGFKARQEIKELKDKKGAPKSPDQTPTSKEEEIDIDLNDPEVNAAAVKIQAGFKGHKTRQQLKEKKEKDSKVEAQKESEPQAQEEKVEAEDDEEAKAQEENSEPKTEQETSEPQTKDSPVPQSDKVPKPQTEMASEPESGVKENDEEIDIDLNDPEVAQAALKIQTGFRGHLARKEVQAMKESKQEKSKEQEEDVDIDLEDPEVEKAALKIQAGFKGMQARQEIKAMKEAKEGKDTEETKEEVDIDLKDPETEKAALKIQAGFKGYQTRKEIKARKYAQSKETNEENEEKKEDIDIDLNDPEVEKAATKIQAGFKGFKTRQEIKAKKESGTDSKEADETEQTEEPGEATEGEKIDIDLNDPEVAQAATKIQAGFKGYKTRQEIKARTTEDKKDGE